MNTSETCSGCGGVLVDGDCEACAEVQRELDAEDAPRDDDEALQEHDGP